MSGTRLRLVVLVALVGTLAWLLIPGASAGDGPNPREPELWPSIQAALEGLLREIDPDLSSGPAEAGRGRSRDLARMVDSVLAESRSRRGRGAGAHPETGPPGSVPEPMVGVLERISRSLHRASRLEKGHEVRPEVLDGDLRMAVWELGRLVEKYVRGEAPAPSRRSLATSLATMSAPANDDCLSATPIGEGTHFGTTEGATNDGSASCGSSGSSPDVWFVYTASTSSTKIFDSFGSSFDTVLSLHSGCPGTAANQLECNDDSLGLQSKVALPMTSGDQVWIRASGFGGATGTLVLNVNPGGGFSGTVTDGSTTDPLEGVGVEIYDSSGVFIRPSTGSDGTYTSGDLPPGDYYARTWSSTHLDELYDDLPCADWCDVMSGTAISVGVGSETSGVDFALDLGGSISGTITDASTTSPIPDIEIMIFASSGSFVKSSLSLSDGTFTVGGLPSGSYYVLATHVTTYLDELFDDLPCTFGCVVTTGTPISVTLGSETSGVDFALDLGGTIAGTVTDASTTSPLGGVEVRIYDSSGIWRTTRFTAGNGTYTVVGLPSGNYFTRTLSSDYLDEVYDDVPCEPDCAPTTGTPISVVAGSPTAGIDFALARLGSIAGTVTEAGTATPLSGVRVTAYDSLGRPARSTLALPDGTYLLNGIAAGDVHVMAGPGTSHAAQLRDRLAFGLDILAGATVPVSLSTTTSGVDFALWPLGACKLPESLQLSSILLTGVTEYAVCSTLTVGPQFELAGSGAVALSAGGAVAFESDVAVLTGGSLVVASGSIFPPPVGNIVYSESFDDGFAVGWDTSNGATDLWRLDSGCSTAPSGPTTLAFNRSAPDCDYKLMQEVPDGWARSPVIDLSSATTASLQFNHSWVTEGGEGFWDIMLVQASSDGGASWTQIWTTTAATSGGFVPASLDVSAFRTPGFRIRFVFDSVDDIANDFAGWFIDDVVVMAN